MCGRRVCSLRIYGSTYARGHLKRLRRLAVLEELQFLRGAPRPERCVIFKGVGGVIKFRQS